MIPFIIKIIRPDYKRPTYDVKTLCFDTKNEVLVCLWGFYSQYLIDHDYDPDEERDIVSFLQHRYREYYMEDLPVTASIFYNNQWVDVEKLWPDFYDAVRKLLQEKKTEN